MLKVNVPLNGLAYKNDTPEALIGTLRTCTNWLKWKGMLKQPNGSANLAAANAAHSAIWHRDANNNTWIVYTDGSDLKKINASNNAVSTIQANEFAANAGTARWPVARFNSHIMFGSAHDGLHWFYPPGYSGDYSGKAGVAAPANAANGAANGSANGMTGVYQLVYTFVNTQNHESAPSPASESVCVYDHPIDWSNIAVGPAGTTARRLYRTVNDGALFLYLAELSDNVTTVYLDEAEDTALGAEVEFDNSDTPPDNIRGMAVAGSRLYILDNSDVIWSCKIDPDNALPNWEAYPSALSTHIPAGESSDTVQNIFSIGSTIYAATRNRLFRLFGSPYSGTQVQKIAEVGLYNRWSWCYGDVNKDFVFMLTGDLKVVKISPSGVWEEVGGDLAEFLKSLTNYAAPDLGDSVDMLYDSDKNIITLNCATTGTDNHTTYVLDLYTGHWSQVDWGFMFSLADDTGQKHIGYEKGTRLVWHSATEYQKISGTYFTTQRVETYPFSMTDKQMQIGRIGIVCRALPLSGLIPPMIQVSWAPNNNDQWTAQYVDVSNIPRRVGGVGSSLVAQERITVFVPVFKTLESISIRIDAPQNAAALQGFEIYGMFLEVENAEEGQQEGRDIDRDRS